jgi:hypothetical protein
MAKYSKKVVPDEDVKDVISDDKKAPKKGASVKILGTIIKPLSPDKDKEDVDALSDSSLRSPIEAVLLHEFAKHKMEKLEDPSEDNLVCMIKDLIKGYDRHNYDFLKRRESYDKDLGLLSSILTDVLPKGSGLKRLIARALFEDHYHPEEPHSMAMPSPLHNQEMKKDLPEEVLKLLK